MSRFLAWIVSILLVLLVIEGITRLLSAAKPTEYDPRFGWTYRENVHQVRKTMDGTEWDFRTSEDRLRLPSGFGRDPKKTGEFRVLLLGDSFTLGWGLELDETFASVLERRLEKEGHAATVIPIGIEGFSTDQECLWLESHGSEYAPDLVIAMPYANDVALNAKDHYLAFAKPLFAIGSDGNVSAAPQPVADDRGLLLRVSRLYSLVNSMVLGFKSVLDVPAESGGGRMQLDDWVYLRKEPADVTAGWRSTSAIAKRLVEKAKALGAKVAAAPIPDRFEMQPGDGAEFAAMHGISSSALDFSIPTRRLGEVFAAAGATVLDTKARIAPPSGTRHYFAQDWHFNAAGAAVFGNALYEELAKVNLLPPASTTRASVGLAAAAVHPTQGGIPTWAFVVGALWIVLSIAFKVAYPDEAAWIAPIKVGALLASVVLVVIGVTKGTALLPGPAKAAIFVVLIGGIGIYAIVKTRSRFGTIRELFGALVDRGHWYLVPMLVVMLTISVLLVVAQKPIVAPFIYTLF